MSFLIACLLGPILIVAAIPMIGSPRRTEALVRRFLQSPALIFVAGIGVLAAGLAIVNAHNRWAADWTVLITIFGWALAIAAHSGSWRRGWWCGSGSGSRISRR